VIPGKRQPTSARARFGTRVDRVAPLITLMLVVDAADRK
jgi:hypothetical protein